MIRTASNTDAPLDPPDTSAQDEREAREMAQAIAKLCTFQSFVDDAESSASQEDHDHMMGVLLSGDVLEAHRLRECIWRDYAATVIEREAKGLRHPLCAAYIVVRRFQADEARRFPNRSASTVPPDRAASPGTPAERPVSPPQIDTAVTPGAAAFSSDTRAAA